MYIGSSWFVIAGMLVLFLGPQIGRTVPGLGWASYGAALLYALLLLASVLLHEFSHALAARKFGYRVDRIVADLLGGHTVYQATSPSPGRQAWIAFVGPLSNGLLAVAGGIAAWYVEDPLAWVLIGALTWTNGFVALFNLLPGLPLDGGHVVEALVWKITGKRHRGMAVAGWLGRGVVVALVGYVLWSALRSPGGPSLWNVMILALLGAYLWAGSSDAIKGSKVLASLGRLDLSRLLHPVRLMRVTAPLRELPEAGPDEEGRLPAVIVVVDDEHTPPSPLGYLDPAATSDALAAGAGDAPASSCLRACPSRWVVDVEPQAVTAEKVARWMNERGQAVLLLRGQDGPFAVAEANMLAAALERSVGIIGVATVADTAGNAGVWGNGFGGGLL